MPDLKEALEYLFTRLRDKREAIQVVDGQPYSLSQFGTIDKAIRPLAPQWTKPTLIVATLQSLADAYTASIDGLKPEDVAFHIVDYRTVRIISLIADEFGERHVWAQAKHEAETKFVFGKYYEPEEFLIAFRSSFLFNEDATSVQMLCSSVGSGDAVLVTDDGISQTVEIKSGTVTRQAVPLPADGVPLIPWRTFREASPVSSKFLLRMKGVKDALPQIALFEIDAKWQLDTVGSIRTWIWKNVDGATIIA